MAEERIEPDVYEAGEIAMVLTIDAWTRMGVTTRPPLPKR